MVDMVFTAISTFSNHLRLYQLKLTAEMIKLKITKNGPID